MPYLQPSPGLQAPVNNSHIMITLVIIVPVVMVRFMGYFVELKVAYYSFVRVQEVYTTNVQI